MKRILLCALLAVGLSHGQSGALSWSIYQQILTNSTTAPPFTSPNFRNVGQTTHQIIVTFLPNPTQLCIGSVGNMTTLQASYDGVNYFAIGAKVNTTSIAIAQNNVFAFVATGAYPRVRFFLDAYNNVTCNVTVDYSGATTNPYTQVIGSGSAGTANPGIPPVVIGGFGDGSIVRTLPICDLTASATVAAGTTVAIVNGVQITPAPAQFARICSIELQNPSTTSAQVTSATITSGTQTSVPCDTSTATLMTVLLYSLLNPITYGNGTGAVLNGVLGGQICLAANAAGAVSYSITYARI